ncbi:MAG: dihydrodipicolinate synthase family protein [Candidatus Pacebacteria bacterium]|nr:dihydrodipicolinate synthase family protein [Candidatus Paceibacterota bacterium]
MIIDKTTGLIAAPPTGFAEDGSVDISVVAPLARHLHTQGVSGVFVNGTTGEGMSLSGEERLALATEWRRGLPAPMKLFVHVGHNSIVEAKRFAAHARKINADAVAAIAPSFFKPTDIDSLVDWCTEVAAAAPQLPFYFYHMPSMSGVNLSMTRFLDAAASRIPNLAGIKFTFEALADYQQALEFDGGRYDVLWGRDEMLLAALATGAKGGVGSTYNVAAPLFLELIKAFKNNDLPTARQLQARAITMINAMVETGNFFAALKAILRQQGVPIAARVRIPLKNLPDRSCVIPTVPHPAGAET